MRSKTLILLMLALGCGLVASIGISQMLQRQDQGPAGDTSPVWVVKTEIKQNDPLTVQNLKLEPWPKEKIPPGALSKLEDIDGKRARVNLFVGEALIDKKVLSKDQMTASSSVPDGYRLYCVAATPESSFGGLLHPDDRVDVLVYVSKGNGIVQTGTKTILQDIKVFAVNDQVRTADDKATESIAAKTVTLLVTPSQAEKLVLANEIGKIKLVMRSPGDKGSSTPAGETLSGMFTSEKADRDREDMNPPSNPKAGLLGLLNHQAAVSQPAVAPEPEPAAALPVETFATQIIRGTEISEVDFKRRIDDPTRWDNGTSAAMSSPASSASESDAPPTDSTPPTTAKNNSKAPAAAPKPAGSKNSVSQGGHS